LALAEDHRRTSEGSVSAGFDVLVRWLKIAPNCWNSGWIEFRLYEIKRRFAEADDNVDALRANTMAAAAALARELERRPYDARLTLSYVYLVGGDLPLSEVINRLAIPLRASPMSSDYLTMIAAVAAGPGFDDAFRPLWEEAKSAATGKISADDANPFWPEILRIAAAVRFSRLTYKQAAADVGLAIDGFYRDAPGAALAAGSAYGERAEYVFYDNPSEPAAALDTAERGLTMLPESQDGRALRQHIVFRMAIYHLAVHREDDAREMLAKYVSPADMNRRLSDLYLDLCKHINLWPVSRFPPSYPSWVQRAVELNPENEVIWKFLADLLMQQGRAADAADSLRRALSLGSDPRTAADITQLYLQRAPESEELKQLLSELEEFLAPKPFGS
jgi:tetratricopeptide (TPR) repeat protein